jgi:uncharacterized protein (UPF0335 family)
VEVEDKMFGAWRKLAWSLVLNGNPHMSIEILDVSEEGKLIFKVSPDLQNGTYEILVRDLRQPKAPPESVATLWVNVPAARNRPPIVDDKVIVDQARFQVIHKIKMDVWLESYKLIMEYELRLADGESKTRPEAEQELVLKELAPLANHKIVVHVEHIERLEEGINALTELYRIIPDRSHAEAMGLRVKILRNHLEDRPLAVSCG